MQHKDLRREHFGATEEGNGYPKHGGLEEVAALSYIFQNREELAGEGDRGRVGSFTAEETSCAKVKNIPRR